MLAVRRWICASPDVIVKLLNNRNFQEKSAVNACGFTIGESKGNKRCQVIFGPWLKQEGTFKEETRGSETHFIGKSDRGSWKVTITLEPFDAGTNVEIKLNLFGWRKSYGNLLTPQIHSRMNQAIFLWKEEAEGRGKTVYEN